MSRKARTVPIPIRNKSIEVRTYEYFFSCTVALVTMRGPPGLLRAPGAGRILLRLPFLLLAFSLTTTKSDGDSDRRRGWSVNDHREQPLSALGLTEEKLAKVMAVFNTPALQTADVQAAAARTGFAVTPHLVFRYLESTDWAEKYHGVPVAAAILETVRWRESYGIIRLAPVELLASKGMGYTGSTLDKAGRSIVYIRVGRNDKTQSAEAYLQHMMYTVERADRVCAAEGSGEFVTIADLSGLSWSTCPPMGVLKDAITLLKKNYPYRLGGIFIVNAPALFHWIWNILKPFMPPRALQKTFVLGPADMAKMLDDKLGLENVEESYGGQQKEMTDVAAYLQAGYWKMKGEGVAAACVVDEHGECA